jgi:hypothetical protein
VGEKAPVVAPAPAAASDAESRREPTPAVTPAPTTPAAAPSPAAKHAPVEPESISVFGRSRTTSAGPPQPQRDVADANDEDDDGSMGTHQAHFYGMLGYRGTRVTGDGYQPFAKNQAFHQASLSVGRVLFTADALSFALGAGWDYGSSSATVRGAATTLEAHRFTLLPELRYHLVRRLYGFGRVGAGLAPIHAELRDSVTETARVSDRLAFTFDASVGAAYELIGEPTGASRRPRVWLLLDGGYVFTATTKTVLENESAVPARSEAYAFADLNLSGLSGRVSAALTF